MRHLLALSGLPLSLIRPPPSLPGSAILDKFEVVQEPTEATAKYVNDPALWKMSGSINSTRRFRIPKTAKNLCAVQGDMPKLDDKLEEGFVEYKPGCNRCADRSLRCTYGNGKSSKNTKRGPVSHKCNFCTTSGKECTCFAGLMSAKRAATEELRQMPQRLSDALNGDGNLMERVRCANKEIAVLEDLLATLGFLKPDKRLAAAQEQRKRQRN